MSTNDLAHRRCRALPAGTPPLAQTQIDAGLAQLPGWTHAGGSIRKTYTFGNFAETMAFVNSVAWIAQREDHHPDLTVGFGTCGVAYSTHSVGGISDNDLICAAKIEALCRT